MDNSTEISIRFTRFDCNSRGFDWQYYNYQVSYTIKGKTKYLQFKYDKNKEMYYLDETIPYNYGQFTINITKKPVEKEELNEYEDFSVNTVSRRFAIKRFPDKTDTGHLDDPIESEHYAGLY